MRHRLAKVIPGLWMQVMGTEMKATQLGCCSGYFVVAVHAKGMHCWKTVEPALSGHRNSEHTVRAF